MPDNYSNVSWQSSDPSATIRDGLDRRPQGTCCPLQAGPAKIAGVRAIDGGKLENARIVEQITALLIGLNIRHKGHGGIRITGLPEGAYKMNSKLSS